jgi:acyl carrier protein
MDITAETHAIVLDVLNLGDRTTITASTPLLGSIPELDSMAVATILTQIEERFGVVIEDDEIDASAFETVQSLAAFVTHKVANAA